MDLTPENISNVEECFYRMIQGIVGRCTCHRDGDGVFRLRFNGKEIAGLDSSVMGEFTIILGDLKYRIPRHDVSRLTAIVTESAPHIRRTANC